VAKKRTRRPNLPAEALERARAELRGESAELPATDGNAASAFASAASAAPAVSRAKFATGTASAASRRIPTMDELRAEYKHVTNDMRKLLITSAVLFVVIIVAAIVLPSVGG
jgi:hypothetical protein